LRSASLVLIFIIIHAGGAERNALRCVNSLWRLDFLVGFCACTEDMQQKSLRKNSSCPVLRQRRDRTMVAAFAS
jgi:hypothetical protein